MAHGIPRPTSFIKRLWQTTTVWEIIVTIAACFGGVVAATKSTSLDFHTATALCVAIVIGVCTIIKIVIAYRQNVAKESVHELSGCLHTLHGVLSAGVHPPLDPRLRITIHVPTTDKRQLQQVTEYVGDERAGDGKAGRYFPSNCGIIGRAFQEKRDVLAASRVSGNTEDYIRTLVDEYHYTEPQARALNASSMSWLVVSLKNHIGEIEGIVYCDSVDPAFFTGQRQFVAGCAGQGIARFVARRYH
jgi:hypothetical protein